MFPLRIQRKQRSERLDVVLCGLCVLALGEDAEQRLGSREAADDEGIVLKVNLTAVLVADVRDGLSKVGELFFFKNECILNKKIKPILLI